MRKRAGHDGLHPVDTGFRDAGGIVACVSDPHARRRIEAAFGRVELVDNPRELVRVLTGGAQCLLVVEPVSRDGESMAPLIRACLARRNVARVAVYYSTANHRPADLLSLGAAGATVLIVQGINDTPSELRKLVSNRNSKVTSRFIVACPDLPARLRSVAEWCVARGGRVSVEEAALQFRVCSRTLSNWAHGCGFANARMLLSRCRVICAIGCADEQGGSIERLALELGYSSAAHLSGFSRRHTGVAFTTALRLHSFEEWCRILFGQRVGAQ